MKDETGLLFTEELDAIVNDWIDCEPLISATVSKNRCRYLTAAANVNNRLSVETQGHYLDWGCGVPVLGVLFKDIACCTSYEPFATAVHEQFASKYGLQITRDLPVSERYDVISMVEVIEHLPVLKDVLPRVVERLKPGGELLVTTPNGARFSQWIEYVRMRRAHPVPIETFLQNSNTYEHHTREFTAKELRKTLEHFGLEIEKLNLTDIQPSFSDQAAFAKIMSREPPKKSKLVKRLLCRFNRSWRPSLVCVARKP